MKKFITSFLQKEEAYKERVRAWFFEHARGPHAEAWLSFFSFAESNVLPIPVDPFLIAMIVANTHRWLYLSVLTAASSVIGGIAGYGIGFFFFEAVGRPIITFYGLTDAFARVQTLFVDNAFWALFIAAFTPIPYKVFTLGAGLFSINFPIFVIASIIGRTLRFFLVGLVTKIYGGVIAKFTYRYFNTVTIVAVIFIIGIFLFLR